MYKYLNFIYIILLLILVFIILFSFKDVMGISVAIFYLLFISTIGILVIMTSPQNLHYFIIGITLILFLIGFLSSLITYSTYEVYYL